MAPNNDGHDDIHRRLLSLEEWRDDMNEFLREQGEARLHDFKDHTDRLAEVHEKVNKTNADLGEVRAEVRSDVASIKGWAAGSAAVASVATALVVFLLDKLLK